MTSWAVIEKWDEEAQKGLLVLGTGIRAARWRWAMTQQQVAWRASVSQSTISKLETGNLQGMRLKTLARIVGVLQAGPGELVPGAPPAPSRRLPRSRTA